jgi:transposase-like protein
VNPTCPNCGLPMTLIEKPKRDQDHNTFECKGCKVIYMTEDHTRVSGKAPLQSN